MSWLIFCQKHIELKLAGLGVAKAKRGILFIQKMQIRKKKFNQTVVTKGQTISKANPDTFISTFRSCFGRIEETINCI